MISITTKKVLYIISTMLIVLACLGSAYAQDIYDQGLYETPRDKKLRETMAVREKDWRNGALVYQIIVDRFAPTTRLEEKKSLYLPPRIFRTWDQVPDNGYQQEGTDHWSSELEFWGGDLESLSGKLDYIEQLGIDVIYLNPIHKAFTNHKYDALDYMKIAPEYGTRDELRTLIEDIHGRKMKLVLDGVFNHMGSQSPYFKEAMENPNSPYREWFFIGDSYKKGYRSWIDSKSLPELRLENPKVRDYIYKNKNSVVQSYLADGIDGWRLDVAFDVGPVYLADLTRTVHQRKPGSLVVGEIWNYPSEWFPAVDGIMNFSAREIIQRMLRGGISASAANEMFTQLIEDAGIENLLKSWLLLDNHDTKRLKNMLPEEWQQSMAQALQFTLPGSPNLYYGVEVGMEGGADPKNRAPMRWDLVSAQNPSLNRTKQLIELRKQYRALRIGNYRPIISESLLAFERHTEQALETVFVIANPSDEAIKETMMIKNSKIMNGTAIVDVFSGERVSEIRSSLMELNVPARSILVLKPVDFEGEWTPYKRVL